MSRGLGATQKAILDALQSSGRIGAVELAHRIGINDRQARRAVDALAKRGLVRLSTRSAKLSDGRAAPRKLFVEAAVAPETQKRARLQATVYLQDGGSVGTSRSLRELVAGIAPKPGRRETRDDLSALAAKRKRDSEPKPQKKKPKVEHVPRAASYPERGK